MAVMSMRVLNRVVMMVLVVWQNDDAVVRHFERGVSAGGGGGDGDGGSNAHVVSSTQVCDCW